MRREGTPHRLDLDAQLEGAEAGGLGAGAPGADHVALDILAAASPEGDLSEVESIPEKSRVHIDMLAVSAWVPALFGQPSLLQRCNPRRRGAAGGGKPNMNQARGGGAGSRACGCITLPAQQRTQWW